MIQVRDLCLTQGAFALRGLSFEVPTGRYAVLMGPSGCGKTTLLEAICGLRPIESGRITLGPRDVTRLGPAHRGIGYVTQEDTLFASMTVADNIAYALRLRKTDSAAAARKVTRLAEVMRITPLLPRRPNRLSGGEKQRVALARALAFDPPVLCLDEPLGALDEHVRADLEDLLKQVQRASGATVLHVTHSRTEAQRLADTILTMQDESITTENAHDATPTQ